MFPKEINSDLLVKFFREVNERRNGGNTVHIMQFTGLMDKNGKEIYEGDIVKQEITINTGFHGNYGLYEITFNNGGFIMTYLKSETGFKLPRGYTGCFLNEIEDISMKLMIFSKQPYQIDQLEIVGNIYETPELLGEDNG
jgi:uncharacterized phage protein (TIGR01671 family)